MFARYTDLHLTLGLQMLFVIGYIFTTIFQRYNQGGRDRVYICFFMYLMIALQGVYIRVNVF